MAKLVLVFAILLLANGVQPFLFNFLTDIQSVISMATDLSDLVTGRHDLTAGKLFKKKVDPVLEKVTELSEKLDEMTRTMNVRMDKLMTAVMNVPSAMKFANLMRQLIGYVTRIDELYVDYQYYIHQKSAFNRYTIEDFSRVMTSHRFGDLQDILRQMYHLFIPGQLDQRDESLLDAMVATLKDTPESKQCGMVKSPQQQLYNLYETVVLTEIKGFTMAGYAYGLLSIYENSTFENEVIKLQNQLVIRCSQYLSSIHQALVGISRDFFNCDPPEHVEGETYSTLDSFFRVIIHEYMMTPWKDCSHSCETLDTSTYYRYYSTDKDIWYPRQDCKGYMGNCMSLDQVTFCEMDQSAPIRYSWIESSSWEKTFGTKDQCINGKNVTLYNLGHSGYQCSTCFCECSGRSSGIKTISLRTQMADIDKNMIVTGVKFEEKGSIYHVQIEQGKLLPGGQIEKDSTHMKELENLYYVNTGDGSVKMENPDNPKEPIKMTEGDDFIFISNKYRKVNLDRIYSQEPGYVVTGVKLSLDPDTQESLHLEVNITPIDFDSGMLNPTDDKPSKWISYKDMSKKDRKVEDRTEVKAGDKNLPTNYYDNAPTSGDFAVVSFAASDKFEDLGRHTVPFLDRRLVTLRPRGPLEGVSLLHIANENSGGFLEFRVTTQDIPTFLNLQMSEQDLEYYSNTYESEALYHPPVEAE